MHDHLQPFPHVSFAGETDPEALAEMRRRIMDHEFPGVITSMFEAHGEIDREELTGEQRALAVGTLHTGVHLLGFLTWKSMLITRRLAEIEALAPGTPDSHWPDDIPF